MENKFVYGKGPVGEPPITIVDIMPSKDDVKKGEPFSDAVGVLLRQDLKLAGINIDDCYRTTIFKQIVEEEHQASLLPKAIDELAQEINVFKPNVILGLGENTLAALAGKGGKNNGIGIWRGSIMNTFGRKTIFTYHPAQEIRGDSRSPYMYKPYEKYIRQFDIKRAADQSAFREFRLPDRLIHIAGSSADVYNFIQRGKNKKYDGHTYCAVDIESIEGIPVCIGLAFTPYEAISIPLWNNLDIQCSNEVSPKKSYSYKLQVSQIPTGDLARIYQLLARFFLDTEIRFLGQNFKYDEDKINRLGFYLWKLYADIGIVNKCISVELAASLAFMTSIYTLEPYYKYEGKEFNPKRDNIRDFLLYNCKDCCVTIEIFLAQLKELEGIPYGLEHLEFRMQLHSLYLAIEKVGFKTDNSVRDKLIEKYVKWLVKNDIELFDICKGYGLTEPINIRSPQQVASLLFDYMKLPKRAGTGEDVLYALVANNVKKTDQKQAINLILESRKINKTIDTYLAAGIDYDNRLRSSYFITGTETFRTSTNSMEPPVRPKKSGWAIQTVTKHGDIGDDLRTYLVADKGYVFVNIDQGQAEPRVCSLLSDDEETLAMLDTLDIHGLTAAKIFGGTIKDYDKKIVGFEKPERFIGKTGRNAYNLGIMKHQLMIDVNTKARKYKIDVEISEWRAKKILETLSEMTPKIQSVFHNTIQELLANDRRMFGTMGASRYFYAEWGRDLFKEAYAFIPQQSVSDKTKSVLLKVKKNRPDVFIMAEAHDAGLFMVRDIGNTVYDFVTEARAYFAEPIDFSRCSIPRRPLVIPTDCEFGFDYCDLQKFSKYKPNETMRLVQDKPMQMEAF